MLAPRAPQQPVREPRQQNQAHRSNRGWLRNGIELAEQAMLFDCAWPGNTRHEIQTGWAISRVAVGIRSVAKLQSPKARLGERCAAWFRQRSEEGPGQWIEGVDFAIVEIANQQFASEIAKTGRSLYNPPGGVQMRIIDVSNEVSVLIELRNKSSGREPRAGILHPEIAANNLDVVWRQPGGDIRIVECGGGKGYRIKRAIEHINFSA